MQSLHGSNHPGYWCPGCHIPVEQKWPAAIPIAHDLWNMHQFVQEFGGRRNYDALREIHPGLLSFESWLVRTGWRGAPREVQKALAQRQR